MGFVDKFVLALKFMFGGFESATDYLYGKFNDFLSGDNIAAKVQKVRDFAVAILKYSKKYEKYCPAIWVNDYLKLQSVFQMLVDTLEDGKVSPEEAEKAIAAVKDAIAEWMK